MALVPRPWDLPGVKGLASAGLGAQPPSGDYSALKALMGGGQPSQADIENDPIYNLELQAIDAQYGGGGGGKVYSYSGPSIADIQAQGAKGHQNINDLYAQLDQYLKGQQNATAMQYAA